MIRCMSCWRQGIHRLLEAPRPHLTVPQLDPVQKRLQGRPAWLSHRVLSMQSPITQCQVLPAPWGYRCRRIVSTSRRCPLSWIAITIHFFHALYFNIMIHRLPIIPFIVFKIHVTCVNPFTQINKQINNNIYIYI